MFKNGLLKEYASIIKMFIRIVDLLMITLSALIIYRLEFGSWKIAYEYQIAVVICLLLTIVIFPLFKLYQSWRGQQGFSIKRAMYRGVWQTQPGPIKFAGMFWRYFSGSEARR